MKTAMQNCLEKFMVEISNEDADKLLEEEKAQITNAFVNGMMQGCTLQLREEFKMVQTPEQFFNERYKENETNI